MSAPALPGDIWAAFAFCLIAALVMVVGPILAGRNGRNRP